MKSTPKNSPNHSSLRGDNRAQLDHPTFPLLDCSYQSTAEAVEHISTIGERGISEMRTFRTISGQFFGAQARREYVKEAIFFGWISCVAAWPGSVLIHQLITTMISAPAGGLW
jgi:hypothetical protein